MDRPHRTLECVVNVSEGRNIDAIDAIASAAGDHLLDVHSDPHHNRSVLTLLGEEAARAVAAEAVARLDLTRHVGVHPRIGVVDVVPFVPLDGLRSGSGSRAGSGAAPGPKVGSGSRSMWTTGGLEAAVDARDAFCRWAAETLGLPCFVYGPERSLPDVRRRAWHGLAPDAGPDQPHPTAGASAVGARPVLVAYNVWLAAGSDLASTKRIASRLRNSALRTLGLPVGERVQVSCNLVDPLEVGPAAVFDAVVSLAAEEAVAVDRAELVGLVPDAVLRAVSEDRWTQLDLAADRTIEARLEARGLPRP